jgi:hypothetical protein
MPTYLEITSVKEAEYQKQLKIQKQLEAERLQLQHQRERENDDLSSEKGVNYRRLRDLLKAEDWKEANKETLAVMLKVSGRQEKGWLDSESIKNFPCTDLRTIDQLWVKYSNGRFGFSVQKRIWEGVGKDYEKFGDRIGWLRKTTVPKKKWLGLKQQAVDKITWLDYKDLTFSTQSPEGHLPVPMRTLSPLLGEIIESKSLFFCGGQLLFFTLLSRLDL